MGYPIINRCLLFDVHRTCAVQMLNITSQKRESAARFSFFLFTLMHLMEHIRWNQKRFDSETSIAVEMMGIYNKTVRIFLSPIFFPNWFIKLSQIIFHSWFQDCGFATLHFFTEFTHSLVLNMHSNYPLTDHVIHQCSQFNKNTLHVIRFLFFSDKNFVFTKIDVQATAAGKQLTVEQTIVDWNALTE